MSKSMFKMVLGVLVLIAGIVGSNLFEKSVQPLVKRDANLSVVNGNDEALVVSQQVQTFNNVPAQICEGVKGAGFALILFGLYGIYKVRKFKIPVTALFLISLLFLMSGCRKPFDRPEYKEVTNAQSAFVIPLEGDTKNKQVKFDSIDFLESKKVAVKRIQITHRWNQTGRLSWVGEWIPDVAVIVVNRSPITVQWEAIEPWKNKTGAKDNAIWTESSDSIGFSMGWTVTAYIEDENAAKFLYWYPSGSLADVLNTEVRGRIQEVASRESAKLVIDDLRTKKNQIAEAVKKDVVEFFPQRGITITTVGMFGGMIYENEKIQNAIDETFVAQQEKVVSAAQFAAQADKNKRIEAEADAKAKAAEKEAQGIANGNLMKAKAEAEGIDAINKAMERAQSSIALLELKRLEIEKAKYAAWNGKYPDTVIGNGANLWVGLGTDKSGTEAKATVVGK